MANYSVQTAKHATLVGATVDTVTFSANGTGLRVANRHATLALYFRFDATDPAAAGDDTYFVGAGTSVTITQRGVTEIRLISSGAADYSVEVY